MDTLTGTLFPLKCYKFSLDDGEHRVIYLLDRDEKIVLVIAVGTRENFYKALERRVPAGGWTTLLK